LSRSEFIFGSRDKGKKLITAAGTISWCFVTHSGVSKPSGNVGELGVKGDMGEWRIKGVGKLATLVSESAAELLGDELKGGSAFRGGS
jgi:hypothetical protein